MLIYEVNLDVPRALDSEWLQWMQQIHIPHLLSTGCFSGYVIGKEHDGEDNRYTIWYFLPSMEHWNRYHQQFADQLRQEHQQQFPTVRAQRRLLEFLHGEVDRFDGT